MKKETRKMNFIYYRITSQQTVKITAASFPLSLKPSGLAKSNYMTPETRKSQKVTLVG